MKKIILTGGGSAGHIIPNIALLPYLEKEFDEIHYIGSKNGIEVGIIKDYPQIIYHGVTSAKLIRKFTLKNIIMPFKIIKSIIECNKIIKEIKPNIVFSKGGYVAVPVVISARKLKIPIIAHESDYSMGLANKIIYKYCNKMCFSFSTCASKYIKKGIYTGSPIRSIILNGNKEEVIQKYKFFNLKPILLIMGGSLGSVAINNVISESLPKLLKSYNIIHIVGKNNINPNIKYNNYVQIDYTNQIQNILCSANVIISRAGSNALFEFLALKKPMLLIPLPKTSSRGDQLLNAKYFENKGFAKVLLQENLTQNSLLQALNELYLNRNKYINTMKKANFTNGTKSIFEIIKKHIK